MRFEFLHLHYKHDGFFFSCILHSYFVHIFLRVFLHCIQKTRTVSHFGPKLSFQNNWKGRITLRILLKPWTFSFHIAMTICALNFNFHTNNFWPKQLYVVFADKKFQPKIFLAFVTWAIKQLSDWLKCPGFCRISSVNPPFQCKN